MADPRSNRTRKARNNHKKPAVYFVGLPLVKSETMTVVTAEQWLRDTVRYPGLMSCFKWVKVREVGVVDVLGALK